MTQTEHLQLIRARCVELLEIAEKRTAGRWKTGRDNSDRNLVYGIAGRLIEARQGEQNINMANAAYVASCAGAAESGWRATVAAIDSMQSPDGLDYLAASKIISAWPIELLNNK